MLLITDGVYEARSPESDQLGIERVLQIVRERIDRPKEEIIRSLHAEIRQFTDSGELRRRDHRAGRGHSRLDQDKTARSDDSRGGLHTWGSLGPEGWSW